MHVRHAQINRKSAIFGLQIGSFQGRSFPTAGQRNEDAGYEGGAECTIGMVWGVGVATALWHYGTMELWQ